MGGWIEALRRAGESRAQSGRAWLDCQDVQPGKAYVRRKIWDVVETAHVSRVIRDSAGISHIRFDLIWKQRDRCFVDGPRTMGLQSFVRLYQLVD